ncbi:hypothetical protein RND81_14G051500 [Saponaria officinalis]|uniref:DUF7794 domain-containing protein n=1 Tax=Saponaria officinalis TaxID=3572 RepID=A0AAW1GL80_SAPOF
MEFTNFLRFFFITLFLLHQFKVESTNDDGSSAVLFIDSNTHQYFRQNIQTNSMSVKEVGATVSVLLGLAPVDISAASSAKLNEVLLPNPFDRPRHVFMLEIGLSQDSQAMVYANRAAFTSGIKSKVIDSDGGAEIELPDKERVAFLSLDGSDDMAVSDKEISDFVTSIGGETLNEELTVPLPSGSKLSLHMGKKADRKFATGLINLVHNMRKAVEMKLDSSESSSDVAELVGGYFDGIKALQEEYGLDDIAQQGMELLLTIVSRVFDSLQARHKGEAVAVLLFSKAHSSQSQRMLDVTIYSARPAARFMEEEVKPSSNSTTLEEVRLVRLTVAWATGIILLIAVYIGAYLLLYMPVTKDTLLYSNVKLD